MPYLSGLFHVSTAMMYLSIILMASSMPSPVLALVRYHLGTKPASCANSDMAVSSGIPTPRSRSHCSVETEKIRLQCYQQFMDMREKMGSSCPVTI